MKHGRADYSRIQDPAADVVLIEAYRAAVAAARAGAGLPNLTHSALQSLIDALTPSIGNLVGGQLPTNPILPDEPVFLLRAHDKLAPGVVREYARFLVRQSGGHADVWFQQEQIIGVAIQMEDWQNRHGYKMPDVPIPSRTAAGGSTSGGAR